jgi:hypothetical protein
MVEIPTPKPYIFMIRVTRQIKCLIAQALGGGWGGGKKLPVGDGDDPGPQLLRHLICLFTLIINIYGLEVGISTIIKFTSGRGWGMTPHPQDLSYKAFYLPSHPDHKYIRFKGGDLKYL